MCRRKSNKPKAFQPTYGTFSKSGAAELESPIGDGDALQSISVIKQRLDATNQDAAELKFLHSVIFGNEGEKKSRKKMLLEFKGLSGRSAASTDAMRVRAHRVLSEPSTKSMVPALAHILALFDKGAVGRTISQIVQFLMSPSLKLCTELTTAAESEEDEEETNGKAQTKQPRAKPAAPRKNAKKAREQRAPQPEEEPSLKRQRGARAGKQKAVAKKPAEKKASKRKAAEVEAEPEPEPEEAGEEEDAPEEEPEGVDVDDEQPDVEMQDEPEEPIQQEGEEEDDEEPVPGLDMHPGPPVIGGPSVPQEMPGEAVQLDQHPAFDGIDSQDQDGEEPEPPPPGLEGDMDHDLATRKHAVYGQVGPPQQEVPPVVPASQRPGIGSQASPCDAAHPGSHGRSQPPQLGPHHLKPPLEGVATSGGQANVSYDNGSVTKARAKGSNKRAPARGAATKSSLGVANAGTGKKSAPHVKRGQQAVAAAAVQKPVAKNIREKPQQRGDREKFLQQAEKHQEELVVVLETVKTLVADHSTHLEGLRKWSSS